MLTSRGLRTPFDLQGRQRRIDLKAKGRRLLCYAMSDNSSYIPFNRPFFSGHELVVIAVATSIGFRNA